MQVEHPASMVSQSCVSVQIPVLLSKVKYMQSVVLLQMSWQLTMSVAISLVRDMPWHRPWQGGKYVLRHASEI